MKDAFFFRDTDTGQLRLFGTCTYPKTHQNAGFGVLICHAFSEERQRSYRSVFLFAEMLAEAGIPSFRFDYRGTGDSEGTLLDATIDTMVNDAVNAYGEAKRRLNINEIVIVGIRLGAAIATRAANAIGDVQRIVLWNPIIEGSSYYRDLLRTEKIINLGRRSTKGEPPTDAPGSVEIDAELISPDMVEQLRSISLSTEAHTTPRYFIAGRESEEMELRDIANLAQQLKNASIDVFCWSGETGDLWSTQSMYDAFHPMKTFAATLRWLGIHTDID